MKAKLNVRIRSSNDTNDFYADCAKVVNLDVLPDKGSVSLDPFDTLFISDVRWNLNDNRMYDVLITLKPDDVTSSPQKMKDKLDQLKDAGWEITSPYGDLIR